MTKVEDQEINKEVTEGDDIIEMSLAQRIVLAAIEDDAVEVQEALEEGVTEKIAELVEERKNFVAATLFMPDMVEDLVQESPSDDDEEDEDDDDSDDEDETEDDDENKDGGE